MNNKIVLLTQTRSGSSLLSSTIQSMLPGDSKDMRKASDWYLIMGDIDDQAIQQYGNVRIQTESTLLPEKAQAVNGHIRVTDNYSNRLLKFINYMGSDYNKLIAADDILKAYQDWHFEKEFVFRVFKDYIMGGDNYWEYLKIANDVKIIHLVRENVLDFIVSRRVAHEHNLWHTYVGIDEPYRVNIDLKLLSDSLIKEEYLTWFVDTNYPNALKVTYSNLQHYFDKTIKSVSDFCGLNGNYTHPELKKINIFPKKNVIINYEEVAKLLVGTKNEWMLDH